MQAVGSLLVSFVRQHGFDGVYLDEYFSVDLFRKIFTPLLSGGMDVDTNGDGHPETMEEIVSQYSQWRNALSTMLRRELGPDAVLIANTVCPVDICTTFPPFYLRLKALWSVCVICDLPAGGPRRRPQLERYHPGDGGAVL